MGTPGDVSSRSWTMSSEFFSLQSGFDVGSFFIFPIHCAVSRQSMDLAVHVDKCGFIRILLFCGLPGLWYCSLVDGVQADSRLRSNAKKSRLYRAGTEMSASVKSRFRSEGMLVSKGGIGCRRSAGDDELGLICGRSNEDGGYPCNNFLDMIVVAIHDSVA